jgi:ankyrin repeat protein
VLYQKAGYSSKLRIITKGISAGPVAPMRMLLEAGNDLNVRFRSSQSFQDMQDKERLGRWATGELPGETLEFFYRRKDARANRAMRALFGRFPKEYVRLFHNDLEFQETKINSDNFESLREFRHVLDAVRPGLDSHNHHQFEYTWTPLHLAAAYGNDEAVKILLDSGANINAGSIGMCDCQEMWVGLRAPEPLRFWTPLHVAICQSHLSTANLLLSRGASAYVEADWLSDREKGEISWLPPNEVSTALHTACYLGHFRLVRTLVEGRYQDIDTPSKKWETPIEYAFYGGHFKDIIPYLVSKGADVNAMAVAGKWYGSMLLVACGLAKYREALGLLKLGADFKDCKDHTSRLTPLHLCARGSHVIATGDDQAFFRGHLAAALLAAGADVEARSCGGDTPLMVAARARDEWFVELLVRYGANVSARNEDGCSPLLLCCDSSSPRDPYVNGMFECDNAIEENRLKCPVANLIDLFIRQGANVNQTDRKGDTPLLCALNRPLSDDVSVMDQIHGAVQSLVLRGADITKKGSRRLLPFQIAFFRGWVDICRLVFSPQVREQLDRLNIMEMIHLAQARYATCGEDIALWELLIELRLAHVIP